MMVFRTLLFVCPMAVLLAQGPAMEVMGQPVGPKVPPDRVVISVGDYKITAAEFEDMISALPAQYQASARGVGRKSFADSIIKVLVLSEEGKRRKLDQNPIFKARAAFDTANILANMTSDQIGNEIKTGEPELRKFYEEHKNEFERVRARHILVRFQGSAVGIRPGTPDLTDAQALAKAQELRAKLVAGADFATLARAESDDSGAPTNGGDLGFFGRGQMVGQFDDTAFSLKVGDLSQPVKSQFGYHIIKVEARQFKSLEEVRSDLERRLKPELAQKMVKDLENKSGVKLDPEFFGPAKQ